MTSSQYKIEFGKLREYESMHSSRVRPNSTLGIRCVYVLRGLSLLYKKPRCAPRYLYQSSTVSTPKVLERVMPQSESALDNGTRSGKFFDWSSLTAIALSDSVVIHFA